MISVLPRLRFPLTGLLLLATLLLAGCAGSPRELSGLVVRVDGIRSVTVRDGQTELVVTMRCHNETIRPIGVRSMELTLELNGVDLGRATSDRPLGTVALGSNTQDVTYVINDAERAARLLAALRSGAVNYQLRARLTVMAADDEMRGNSTSTGSIDVSRLNVPRD